MRTFFKIIGIIIIMGIASTAFYFLYWTKTPTYSLKMIEESVQTNDVETFEKYVDLDALCKKGFDDICEIRFEQNTINSFDYYFLYYDKKGLYKTKKIDSLKTRTENFIAGKTGGKTIVDSKNFSINKISIEKKADKMVLATIEFNDSPQGKIPTVTVKMVKLNNGIWQVKEITNWEDILSTLGEDQYEILTELPDKYEPKNTH